MDVLIATMQFGPGYGQGTERYVRMLAEGLGRMGERVRILAGDPLHLRKVLRLGQQFLDAPPAYHCRTHGVTCVHGLRQEVWLALLDRWRPTIVHVVNPAQIGVGLIGAAERRRIPVVCTVMDFWWLCPKHTLLTADGQICEGAVGWRQCLDCLARSDVRPFVRRAACMPLASSTLLPLLYIGRALMRRTSLAELRRWTRRRWHLLAALNATSAVIFPSKAAEQIVGSHVSGPRRVRIPYGLEHCWFSARRRFRRATPSDPGELVLGHAGTLEPHKGPDLLLEAVRRLGWHRTRVRLAGPPGPASYMSRLKRLAEGLNVEFLGSVPPKRMPEFLRSLDALVFASRWPENLPIIVLEALAVGVPVLGARIQGVQEVLRDPALLFERDDAGDLAKRLEAWLSRPTFPDVDDVLCTVEQMVQHTRAVYAQVLESASSTTAAAPPQYGCAYRPCSEVSSGERPSA